MRNQTHVSHENDEPNRQQTFYFSGNLTYSREYDLAGHTIPYMKPGYEIIFDLSSATEVDSTFIGELIHIKQKTTLPITFRNISPRMQELIQTTKTEKQFYSHEEISQLETIAA